MINLNNFLVLDTLSSIVASTFFVLSINNLLTSLLGPLNGDGVEAVEAIRVNVLVFSG